MWIWRRVDLARRGATRLNSMRVYDLAAKLALRVFLVSLILSLKFERGFPVQKGKELG